MGGHVFGHWNYNAVTERTPDDVGFVESYGIAMRWLDRQQGGLIEDWGGGTGYAKQFVRLGIYELLDGAWSKWASKVVDLRTYVPGNLPDAILLRHVLEYNGQWRQILANALSTFRARLCLVVHTPIVGMTSVEARHPESGIPTLHFSIRDLLSAIYPHRCDVCSLVEGGVNKSGISDTFFFVTAETGQHIVHLPGQFPAEIDAAVGVMS